MNKLVVSKSIKSKKNFLEFNLHSILRPFNVLSNFPFTTGETMGDDYLKTWYVRVVLPFAKRLNAEDVRTLGNIRKVSKLHRMITYCPAPLP